MYTVYMLHVRTIHVNIYALCMLMCYMIMIFVGSCKKSKSRISSGRETRRGIRRR